MSSPILRYHDNTSPAAVVMNQHEFIDNGVLLSDLDAAGFRIKNIGAEPASQIVSAVKSPNNPLILRGAPASFSNASVRDPSKAWYARGKYWCHYSGWVQITAPFYLTLGLASADDPFNGPWTDHGQVMPYNATPGQPDSGLVASTDVYYDDATDELWTFTTWAVDPATAYTGPLTIGLYKCAAGADWTNTASYVKQNGGNPILVTSLPWEGAQGVYAPSIIKVGPTFYMFYSTSNGAGADYFVGYATASSLTGTWTKNPTYVTSHLEEPNIVQMPNGRFLMVGDPFSMNVPGLAVRTADNITDPEWTVEENLFAADQGEWDADTMGSASIVLMPDDPNKALVLYGGGTVVNGANGEARDIGAALLTFGNE